MFYTTHFENVIGNYWCDEPLLDWWLNQQIFCKITWFLIEFAVDKGSINWRDAQLSVAISHDCLCNMKHVILFICTRRGEERRGRQQNLTNKDGWIDGKTNQNSREPICPLCLLICQRTLNHLLIYLCLKLKECTGGFGTSWRCFTTSAVSKWVSDLEWYIPVCPSP